MSKCNFLNQSSIVIHMYHVTRVTDEYLVSKYPRVNQKTQNGECCQNTPVTEQHFNQSYISLIPQCTPMDICEKYLDDARKALKGSMFSKPNPVEAVRSFEGAAQCFENYKNFERAAQCYMETANLIIRMDPLKGAEMLEKAAICTEKVGGSASEYYLKAADIYKNHAIAKYRTNPDQGLQLLQRAAEGFEKGGDRQTAIQCYEVGAEASVKRKDYLNAVHFYGTAGQSFERNKEYKKAVKYYHKVAKLWEIQKVPENVAENYWRMATCLAALEEHEYASQFFVNAAEKYEEAQETYKSMKSYEKASKTLESVQKFVEAAEYYSKAAEIIKSLKNMEKFEELYSKASECYTNAGNTQKAVKIRLLLAETFADDPYRSSSHFQSAIHFAEDNPQLKVDLLKRQGEILVQVRDYSRAGQSYKEAAELLKTLGESPSDCYRRAGNAYVEFAKGMLKVKNQSKAKEGFENASLCFEKAGMPEEVERVHQQMKPKQGKREKQVLDELTRLKEDFEKGMLPGNYYQQIKEGYQELLRRLRR